MLALVVACGGAEEPQGPSCELVAAHMQDVFRTFDVHDVFFARCKADRWSAEARTCFAGVPSDGVSFVKMTCTDRLTRMQTEALTADITQVIKHTSVTIKVPPQPPQPPIDRTVQSLVVHIASNGNMQVGGKDADLAMLDRVFRTAATRFPDTQLIIEADPAANYGMIVDLMDVAKKAGMKKIAFSTAPKP